ncbi:MAG: hypothetical protein ACKVWR_16180, partial [Acidimicrobiales bacterium]
AGIIEFGKGFNYWLNLNHLANEGARWVAVDKLPPSNQSPDLDAVQTYLVDHVTTQELQANVSSDLANNIKVCVRPASPGNPPQVGDEVNVTVRTSYALPLVASVANLADSLFGDGEASFGDINLVGSASVRLEQPLSNPTPGYATCN